MIGYVVVGFAAGLSLLGAFVMGVGFGWAVFKRASAPRLFAPIANSERIAAIKERCNEDAYLKKAIKDYHSGVWMTREDYNLAPNSFKPTKESSVPKEMR